MMPKSQPVNSLRDGEPKNVTRAQIIIDQIWDLKAMNRTDDLEYLLEELPVMMADIKELLT